MLIVPQFLSSSKNVFYSFKKKKKKQSPDKNQNEVQTHALHSEARMVFPHSFPFLRYSLYKVCQPIVL